MKTADVVIIGGGCMGASVAYQLTQRGITDVTLLEREASLGAGSTGRNAGGVRHQFSHEANVRLSLESIQLFEHFEEVIGCPLDFHQHGYLFLLSAPADIDAFARTAAMQQRFGIEVQWLAPEEVPSLAPGVAVDGVRAATYCARDGIADPHGVTQGFAAAARRSGAHIALDTEVTAIRQHHDGAFTISTSRGEVATRTVVNAAGPWARQIGDMLDIALPIQPLRRHIFIAQPPTSAGWVQDGARTAPESRIMVIDFESTFYFHREGANLLFGMGDPDEKFGYETTVDERVLEKVAPVASRRLPVLADAPISHAWAGLYEMTPDAMPILGPIDDVPGLHVISGFSGHGFQHAPAAGRLVAAVIAGEEPDIDMTPFAYARFAAGALQGEANVV